MYKDYNNICNIIIEQLERALFNIDFDNIEATLEDFEFLLGLLIKDKKIKNVKKEAKLILDEFKTRKAIFVKLGKYKRSINFKILPDKTLRCYLSE